MQVGFKMLHVIIKKTADSLGFSRYTFVGE